MAALLSLCMIVRNEAHRLSACLSSVADLVDEMVIVDTGSADETPAIARQAGARLLHRPWTHSFSAARNHSLAHATGRWILTMDADERLAPHSRSLLRPFLRSTDAIGATLQISLHPDWTPMRRLSLFRRDTGLRFRGIFHENLCLPPELRTRIAHTQMQILHEPWSPQTNARKKDRNLSLLHAHLRVYPRDVYQRIEHIRICLETKNTQSAARQLARVRQLIPRSRPALQSMYRAHYWLYLLKLHALCGSRPAVRLRICRQAIRQVPTCIPVLMEAGQIYFHYCHFGQAAALFARSLGLARTGRYERDIMFPRCMLAALPLRKLGHCAFRQQRYRRAAAFFKQSLACADDRDTRYLLQACSRAQQEPAPC